MNGFVVGDKLLTVIINNCRIQLKHLLAGSNFFQKSNGENCFAILHFRVCHLDCGNFYIKAAEKTVIFTILVILIS